MTPAIILGTIFSVIIIFLASISLYEIIKFAIREKLEGLFILSGFVILLYGMLMVGFIEYILYTFK